MSGQAETPTLHKNESKRKRLKEKLKKLKKDKFILSTDENQKNEITEQSENTVVSAVSEKESVSEVTNLEEQNDTMTLFGKPIDLNEVENEQILTKVTEENENLQVDEDDEVDEIVSDVEKTDEPSFKDVLEISANEGLLSSETDDFFQELPKIKNILELDDEEITPQEVVDTPQDMVDNYDERADIATLLNDEEIATIESELRDKYKEDAQEIIEEPQLFSEVSDFEVSEYEQGILEVPDEDI